MQQRCCQSGSRRVNQRRARPGTRITARRTQWRWGRGLTACRSLEWGGYLPSKSAPWPGKLIAPKVNCVRPTFYTDGSQTDLVRLKQMALSPRQVFEPALGELCLFNRMAQYPFASSVVPKPNTELASRHRGATHLGNGTAGTSRIATQPTSVAAVRLWFGKCLHGQAILTL